MASRYGAEVFSLVGSGTPPQGRRATPRLRANAALIRHRQKLIPKAIQGARLEVWMKWQAWQLEWENAILRYRDGNNDGKDNDDD